MKKIVLAMVALLSMTVAVAQDSEKKDGNAPQQPTPEEMVERMAKDLNLTADQKAKVLALNKEYQDVLRGPGMGPRRHHPEGRPDGDQKDQKDKKDKKELKDKKDKKADKGERPERPELTDAQKAEMKARWEKRKEYDQKLQTILTAQQYKQWKKHHPRRGGRGHGGRRG